MRENAHIPRRTVAALALTAALLSPGLVLAPPASAQTGSAGPLVLIPLYEDRAYHPGEGFDFTIFTFFEGQAVDAGEPPVVSVLDGQRQPLYTVPVAQSAPGSYEGRYTVLAADARSDGEVELQVKASLSGQSWPDTRDAEAAMLVRLALCETAAGPAPSFIAALTSSSDSVLRPGSRLAFRCRVTLEGAPYDPPELEFYMHHSGSVHNKSLPSKAEQERAGPGDYTVRYQIPQMNSSDVLQLRARWANGTSSLPVGQELRLDLFLVVYHELKRSGSRTDFELLVSDRDGKPVNGSEVDLRVDIEGANGTTRYFVGAGSTDGSGRLKTFIDLGPEGRSANISGYVNTSKYSQGIWGRLPSTSEQKSNLGHGTGSGRLTAEETAWAGARAPGGNVSVTYRLLLDKSPLALQRVDCYLRTRAIAANGQASMGVLPLSTATDEQGLFRLNLSFPAGANSSIELLLVAAGQSCSDSFEARPAPERSPPWVDAKFSTAEPGGKLSACVTAPGLLSATMYWSIDRGDSGTEQPGWAVWSALEAVLTPPQDASLPLKGRFTLPGKLRPGTNISIHMMFVNASGEPSSATYDLRMKSPVEPQAEGDLCCYASAAVFNIALLAFVLISYYAAKRAPPKKEFEELEVDERITESLRPQEGKPAPSVPEPPLPFRVELVHSEPCSLCGRKIASGNAAFGCACGKKYHEHCIPPGTGACPNCRREWKLKK